DFGLLGPVSDLSFSLNATFLDEFKITPIADLGIVNDCTGAFGRTCGEPKSETKVNTAVNWHTGDLTLGLRYRWTESTKLDDVVLPARRGEPGPSPEDVAVFELDGKGYLDLSANYDVSDSLSIWGGIINVLDEDPPLLGSRQVRANTSPDTFSPTGAEFFLGASYRLR
ncbi:MAG TPA: hypothetical protein VJ883_00700, partial [Woeseiaceae bacterium]|nr:hypothetical protein [Woeseiaceae bacterium]